MARNLKYTLILLAIMFFLFSIIYHLRIQLHGDILYFLTIGKQILKGSKLYVDIIDLNSPTIFYYHAIIDLLSQTFSINQSITFIIFTLGFLATICLLITILLKLTPLNNSKYLYLLLVLTLLLFTGYDFGQREYLILILLSPYILVVINRFYRSSTINNYLLVLAGLLAAIGTTIKPIYVIIILYVELYLAINKRKINLFRHEFISFSSCIFIYTIFIIIRLPSYINILWLTLQTYGGFHVNGFTVINIETFSVVFIVLFMVIFMARGYRNPIAIFWIGLTIFSWGIAILQTKGFTHHYLPFRMCFGIFLIYFYAHINNIQKLGIYLKIYSHLIFAFLLLTITILPIINNTNYLPTNSSEYSQLIGYLDKEGRNTQIAVLTTELYPMAYIDNFVDVEWTTKYRNYWMLPGLYKNEPIQAKPFPYHLPNQMSAAEQELFTTTINDIIMKKPKYIFMLKPGYMSGFTETTFDFREYFSQDPQFKEYLKKYSLDKQLFKYNIYTSNN